MKNDRNDIWILGVNSAYHEPSACIIHNGKIIGAADEERFNRLRHGKVADLKNPHWMPERSIRYCMEQAGIRVDELSHIAFSIAPELRLASNVNVDSETTSGGAGTPEGEALFHELLLQVPKRLSLLLGGDVRDSFRWVEHHLCHAASTFFVSPFRDAAILTLDGIGETTTTWMGYGSGNRMQMLNSAKYPNSLGFLWTKLSRFLGFGNYGQWKVMALAAYGDSDRYYGAFRKFIRYDDNGSLEIDGDTLQFRVESCKALERLLGQKRAAQSPIDDHHKDIAAALQQVTNEAAVAMARWLRKQTGCKNICLAGGVALNCIMNRVVLNESGFEDLFIQPASNDGGTALGGCYYIWNQLLGRERNEVMVHAYLGPEYSRDALCLISQVNVEAVQKITNLPERAAKLIAQGKIVALFQGRMEFGPRALGNRSILADPRRSDIIYLLNEKVKHREGFRPFAASVLAERTKEWFTIRFETMADRFMVLAYPVRPEKLGTIPAVTHVDGTTRIQSVDRESNPVFRRIIEEFDRITGVPLLLNTSLNESEPIVCTPADALRTCLEAGIDYLAIEGHLIDIVRCDESVYRMLEITDYSNNHLLKQPSHRQPAPADLSNGNEPVVADCTSAVDDDVSVVFMSR